MSSIFKLVIGNNPSSDLLADSYVGSLDEGDQNTINYAKNTDKYSLEMNVKLATLFSSARITELPTAESVLPELKDIAFMNIYPPHIILLLKCNQTNIYFLM